MKSDYSLLDGPATIEVNPSIDMAEIRITPLTAHETTEMVHFTVDVYACTSSEYTHRDSVSLISLCLFSF